MGHPASRSWHKAASVSTRGETTAFAEPLGCSSHYPLAGTGARALPSETPPGGYSRMGGRGGGLLPLHKPPRLRVLPNLPRPGVPRPSPQSPAVVREQAANLQSRSTKTGSASPQLSALARSQSSARPAQLDSQTANQCCGHIRWFIDSQSEPWTHRLP